MKEPPRVVVDKPEYKTIRYVDDNGCVYYVEYPRDVQKRKRKTKEES